MEWFKAAQITLGIPTIIMAAWVVYEWRHSLVDFWKNNNQSAKWFALGVFSHFTCTIVDYTYWNHTWTLDYVNSLDAAGWFQGGVYTNVLFRLLGTSFAAYCHIRSARTHRGASVVGLNVRVFLIYLIGFLYEWHLRL